MVVSTSIYSGQETQDLSSLEHIRPEDEENLEYVLDSLDEYVWHHGEGPVWLTGSSQYRSDYGDIDIVVERGATLDSGEDYPLERDYKMIHDMLADRDDFDLDERVSAKESLLESDDVRVNFYGQTSPAIARYKFSIEDTDFDVNFDSTPPNNEGIELAPFYGERNL